MYDGQEAVAVGINSVLTSDDSIMAGYRIHCIAITRGITVEEVIAELHGKATGATRGKGGSMHLYRKRNNFYGGQGIVGAQAPLAAGIAFADKYRVLQSKDESHLKTKRLNITLAIYGDGGANQGQVWEAANMASLWKLPVVFMIENNHYGMGTAPDRSSSNTKYYTMGNHIPGIRINGMNVLAVREGMKVAKEYVSSGHGPIYVEMDTCRYQGHSMSDPDTTYQSREAIGEIRKSKDPIEYVKKLLIDNHLMTLEEIKDTQKDIRYEVNDALQRVKQADYPPIKWLTEDIYSNDEGENDPPLSVRMPDRVKSVCVNK